MGIDHESSTPLYVQLAALLRSQIEDGTITKRLPSAKTLSQEHSVSHNYDAQLGGGWERFELILTPQGSAATPGAASLIGSATHG